KNIFSLIRERNAEIKLNIVGRSPVQRVRALANIEGVTLFSDVPEVRPFYEKSAVSVVPLRSGGGTRLKILESMAFGVPVVSTSIGCEGLDVTHGENILIADTPKAFAESVLSILNDQSLRNKLINNGRKLVENKYDWDIIATRLLKIYDELLR
ncbi:MAG: glycosyltransferase family 4 protein, partial [Armatimonadota bacterium]|nr:glycosyltransferase family 4 protein [Armatimonadota bacterium]